MAGFTSHRQYKAAVLAASDLLVVMKERGVVPSVGMMAHCPFHPDDRPSLSIVATPRSGHDQYFNCHGAGCGKAGDVIQFVALMDGVTYGAALDALAQRAGLPVYRAVQSDRDDEELRAQVQAVLDFASHYFRWKWNDAATAYLVDERRIPIEFVDRFRLGYADGGLAEYMFQQWGEAWGPVIAFAGVAEPSRRPGAGAVYRDRFFKRLMFPVFVGERPVFLTGRSLDGSDPKYLHQKGREAPLYNEDAINPKELFVVEGPVDTLSLEAWDFPTTGFQGGMRESAVGKLRRVRRIYTVLDADTAGITATIKMAVALGDQLRCVTLPPGSDPNDFYRTHTKTEFEDRVAAATDPVRFALQQVSPTVPPEALSFALEPVLRLLAAFPPITSEAYVESVLVPRYKVLQSKRGLAAVQAEIDTYRVSAAQACPSCGARLVVRK